LGVVHSRNRKERTMADPRFIRTGDVQFAMAHAAEECGEVIAALGKSLRWGLDSVNPLLPVEQQETNREIADLRGALDRLDKEMSA
jgi:hypothetical protein